VTLLTFVLLRVDEQCVGSVDDGSPDCLSWRTVDVAHDVDGLLDESRHGSLRHAVVGRPVLDEQLDGATEEAAAVVEVIDHHRWRR
jgi:hypothetical protein